MQPGGRGLGMIVAAIAVAFFAILALRAQKTE